MNEDELIAVARSVFHADSDRARGAALFGVPDADPSDFGMANRHHDNPDFPKVHVVFPDDDGRLPGEPGCEVEQFQMLGLPA